MVLKLFKCNFCFKIIPNFYPPLTEKVRNGIFSSLRQILEKRVLPSLYPLFDSPKLDRELRSKIRETFKEFCLPPNADPGKIIALYCMFILYRSFEMKALKKSLLLHMYKFLSIHRILKFMLFFISYTYLKF